MDVLELSNQLGLNCGRLYVLVIRINFWILFNQCYVIIFCEIFYIINIVYQIGFSKDGVLQVFEVKVYLNVGCLCDVFFEVCK